MKFSLLDYLTVEDQRTREWILVARRVLEGGYDDASLSTLKSIAIGLSSIQHPDCRAALTKIVGLKERL